MTKSSVGEPTTPTSGFPDERDLKCERILYKSWRHCTENQLRVVILNCKDPENGNMKTLVLYIFGMLMAAETMAGPDEESPQLQVETANQEFAVNFYKTLASKQPGKDIFFSPLGIHTILSMIYPGAENETKAALTKTLHVTDPIQTAEGYDKTIQELNNVENVTLHIANKIYLAEHYKFQEAYGNIVEKQFHSAVEKIDFGADLEAAATKVNGWVSDHTKGKIPKLFEVSDFTGDTRMVLLNAIYFKGNWQHKFEKLATKTEPFYVNGKEEKIDVQMMHRRGPYNYKVDTDLEAQVLEMPFTGDGINMFIVLPLDINGIDKLEEKVQTQGIKKVTSDLQSINVQVALPKFKLETKMDLKVPLTDMGLGVLFDEMLCNLGKMVDNDDQLFVSKAIQKAFIEVNEDGAEATAATGGVAIPLSLPFVRKKYEIFHVDHPFLVVLKKDHNILFYGRIMRPNFQTNPSYKIQTEETPNYFF